jgi:hypothetical protein
VKPEPDEKDKEPPTLPLTDAAEEPELTTISPADISTAPLPDDLETPDRPTSPVEIDTEPLDPTTVAPDETTREPEPEPEPTLPLVSVDPDDIIDTDPLDPDTLGPLNKDTDPPGPVDD